jgi:DNA-binding response OmpR family regulator
VIAITSSLVFLNGPKSRRLVVLNLKHNNKPMKSILLIEDHDLMRLFLINFLGKVYQVYAVKTPEEAVEWLRFGTVDLILSDYPNSPQLIIQTRALRATADEKIIPIIILTDQDKSEERVQALRWGAKDCLSKPFNPLELKIRIETNFHYNRNSV